MKKALMILLAATTLSGVAGAGESHEYAQNGGWVNYWVRSDDGTLGCGMRFGTPARADSRSIHIKWFNDQEHLQFSLFKNSWLIPAGTDVRVEVGVDDHSFGFAIGKGRTVRGSDYQFGTVSFNIGDIGDGGAKMAEFLEGFRDAKKLWVRFPNGTEGGWRADMAGSRAALSAFGECSQRIKRKPATQPFGNEPQASQPFGNSPRPVPAPASRNSI